jgi:hypothetical protein
MTGPTKLDRRAVMQRAWRDFRWWRRHGDPRTFSECLRAAWAAARLARDSGSPKFQLAA